MELNPLELPASKGDVVRIMEELKILIAPVLPETIKAENPVLVLLEKRLVLIEKASRAAAGVGLNDIPIDAETAAIITGLAEGTIKKYGAYQLIPTIKIGKKLQYSLKGCIHLVKTGSRPAILECTTDMTNKTKRRKRKGKTNGKGNRGKD